MSWMIQPTQRPSDPANITRRDGTTEKRRLERTMELELKEKSTLSREAAAARLPR
jgi:hypothetical protein